jgi:isopentenyl phosphate kinase
MVVIEVAPRKLVIQLEITPRRFLVHAAGSFAHATTWPDR